MERHPWKLSTSFRSKGYQTGTEYRSRLRGASLRGKTSGGATPGIRTISFAAKAAPLPCLHLQKTLAKSPRACYNMKAAKLCTRSLADKVFDSDSKDRGFKSRRVRHLPTSGLIQSSRRENDGCLVVRGHSSHIYYVARVNIDAFYLHQVKSIFNASYLTSADSDPPPPVHAPPFLSFRGMYKLHKANLGAICLVSSHIR